ncbi:PD-(D/E)XK motif protein [Brachybacterium sp.]|uniref:PD-(D/E)XK motif protein n=1 Tax=Brachybacterium sp. TaxID=1891286 RepID=UPI002ED650F6
MPGGHSRVQSAYEKLRVEHVAEGESASTLLGPSGRLRDAILVKDHVGLIHLMAHLPEDRERFDVPLGRVLRATWVEADGGDGPAIALDIVCLDARLIRTFLSLVGEMLDRSDTSGRPCIDELIEVLESWRAALARARNVMDRNRIVGIFGELTVLEQLARRDPQAALAAWGGRKGARHDFARTNALEVKTLTGSGSPAVTIHGESQLEPPTNAQLHLVAFRVVDSASGESVEELTDRITSHGVPREEILRTLGDDAPGEEDRRRRFEIEETRLHVVGDDFPGIRATRLDASTLRGVSELSYRLSLDSCPGELVPSELVRVLEEL